MMPRALLTASSEHLAIVGCAFRFPGANSRDALWQALIGGRDLVTSVDPTRWAQDAVLHPRKSEPGTSYTFAAGSLGDIAGFDAEFFGISPREAVQMDPQQRILLELAWEACEDAGVPPSHLQASRCGVFVGVSATDYAYRLADDLGAIDATTMTGNTASIAANRLSYFFDLRGPSMAVDTACSSSLVAFHQACRSILSGESTAALAGGIGLHLHPFGFLGFSKASMLSRRGRCTPFDAEGDGYVRSEGGALVLIKRLDDAIAAGDRVLAVVLGSAVNTDGRKKGLTVPSHLAQEDLLRDVYRRCGIAPDQIDYIEAHGTGTAVGDPIETRALGDALGRNRSAGRPLLIGSVKSNVGHLEVASGMAGLVKALLCLEHRQIPPTINVGTPNPNIDFDAWNLRAVTDPTPLDAGRRLVVGVNSFGFGGANAHVVVASPESLPRGIQAVPAGETTAPLLLSARGAPALAALASALATHLRGRPEVDLYDVAAALAFGRDTLTDRLAVFAGGREATAEALTRFAYGETPAGLVTGRLLPRAQGPVFVFAGNGSQWVGMGQALLEENASFRAAVEAVDALFAPLGGFSLVAALQEPASADCLAATEVAQPLLFAVQVGLTRLFADRGIAPLAVVGHSVGEVAAAWACGALTLAQAVTVIYERSTHQASTRASGQMTAVAIGETEARALLEGLGITAQICVAGINSARSITVAGRENALAHFEAALSARSIWFRRLALDYAFHSPAMDPIRDALIEALADLSPCESAVPFYSTVSGSLLSGSALNADYWWRNVRQPVRFHEAVKGLVEAGFNAFIEIGPSPVLRAYLNETIKDAAEDGLVLPTLSRDAADPAQIDRVFHQLLLSGIAFDWGRLFPRRGRFVDLPHYPWQRERYWRATTSEGYGLIDRRKEHPILGYRLKEDLFHWENHLDTSLYPLLADHAVGDAVVFPAAGFVEMALAAATLWRPDQASDIEGLEIAAPLLLEIDCSKTLRFQIDARDGSFNIRSRARLSDDPWLVHVVGRIAEAAATRVPAACGPLPTTVPDASSDLHYRRAGAVGLDYGPSFRSVDAVWVAGDIATASLVTPDEVLAELGDARLHPAYLDGAFQLLADLLAGRGGDRPTPAFIPIRVERLRLFQTGARVGQVQATLRRGGRRSVLVDFALYDGAGEAVAAVERVRFRAVQLKRPAIEPMRQIEMTAIPRPRPGDTRRSVAASVDKLAALAAERLHEPARVVSRGEYLGEVEPLLDAMCASFALQALRHLDPHGAWIDPTQLLNSGTVTPACEPLLRNLLRMMADDDILEEAGGRWLWRDESVLPDARDIWISLMGDYPDYAGLVGLAGRSGLRLPDILSGRMDPKEIVDPKADVAAIGPFGSETGFAHRIAAVVADIIADIGARLVQGRRPRVLEMIGEAGGATCLLALVDAVPCDLVVAAPNEERRADLASLLRHKPSILTCVLDPVDPGASLGPLGGRFDLVVLSGGLGIRDPAALLSQVRPLIAQNGALMTVEQYPTRVHNLCFGLHAGWWSMGKHQSPLPRLRTPEAWQGLLARQGFADTAIVPDVPDATGAQYLMFAQASDDAQPVEATLLGNGGAGLWYLMVDTTPYAAALAQQLADCLGARGQRVLCIAQGSAYKAPAEVGAEVTLGDGGDWSRLVDDLRTGGEEPSAIVNLVGLDPGYATGDAAQFLERQEQRVSALLASLRGCAAAGVRPRYYLVTAHAGVGLLPAAMRQALGSARCVGDAPIWALARVAMNEFPELQVRWVDLAEVRTPKESAQVLAAELLEPDGEDEVILLSNGRFVPRARVLGPEHRCGTRPPAPERRIYLDFAAPGPLKNLAWCSDELPVPDDGEVEIAVRAVGLNFRDVMYAMGLLPDEALESGFSGQTLGMELSGVVTAVGPGVAETCVGDEVIAFAPAAFASRVVTRATAVVPKPKGWSFAAAATIPTAFFTAYYAIKELAQLGEGERILIHGAAGGVGIAAIQIAKQLGAEIFATAGTPEKRDIVRMLGADHVLDSRSLAFADDILDTTGGTGVDVVLNSLAGEGINRNLRVLRPFGRFLELGKRDFFENTHIGLRPFRNNIAYFGIDADQLMVERPALARRVFLDLMSLFGRKLLKPLPYRAFDASEVVDAFRYMQHSRQIGKVVVTFPEGFAPVSALAREYPALRLRDDATYLVTGGLSGFGLRTAQWLADKGARSLVLLSRRGEEGEDVPHATLAELRAAGVQVWAPVCDVTDRVALADVLAKLGADLPPLCGIVHAAMVIDDALLRNLTRPQLHRVLAPKVLGALHLDALTEGVPLDFFVLYSSATTLFGSPGQGNYVAANMTLEGLAADRRVRGEPATCISWGPIEDVGYLARNVEVKDALVARLGGQPLRADEALAILEEVLVCGASNLAVLDLAWGAMERYLPSAGAPKFSELAALGWDAAPGADGGDDLRRRLDGLDLGDLQAAVIDILRQELSEILRLAPDKLDIGRSVYDMGMDSLMGAELITALDARLGITLPLMALSEGPTIARLAERIVHQLRPASLTGAQESVSTEHVRQVQQVAMQHGHDLDPAMAEAVSASLSARTATAAVSVTRGKD